MTTVLIVEPVSSGNDLVARAAKFGWRVVIASYNSEDRIVPDTTKRLATALIEVDTNDLASMIEAINVNFSEEELHGIVAGSEFHVEIVSDLAHKLGLPGLERTTALLVRNKARMRNALDENRVFSPRYREVTSREEAFKVAQELTFPVVVKPTDSSGSVHVTKAATPKAAVHAYDEIAADRRYDLGRQLGRSAVIEEYVPGDEYSADGYVWQGTVTVLAVTRKLLGAEPAFVELGHVTPAPLPDTDIEMINKYVIEVTNAVALGNSVFHCELRLTDQGPVLMEIAARLAGDQIVRLVESATGVSLADVALWIAIDRSPQQLVSAGAGQAAGIRFIDSNGLATYNELVGWNEVDHQISVIDKQVLIKPGEKIPTDFDFRCRIAYVRYSALDSTSALAINEELGQILYPIQAPS